MVKCLGNINNGLGIAWIKPAVIGRFIGTIVDCLEWPKVKNERPGTAP